MTILRIDIETKSSADLKKAGVYKYAESPDFEVLLFGFAFAGEPVVDVDLAQGQELPPRVLDAITDPGVIKTAFNANFEITCLSRHFGRPLPAEQWRCTAVHASYLGMPNNLADVAKVVGLPDDLQKMTSGWQLIRYFCMPCKPTKANGGRTWNLPRHDPAKWKLFRQYCRRDVEVERAIAKKIEKFPLPEKEQALWVIDQEINCRGIAVDRQLVKQAIELDAIVKDRLIAEAIKLTGLDNVNSRDQLIGWLESAQGEEIESLTKDDVPDLINRAANGEVRRVLEIRQEMAKTSVRKYQAIDAAVCADGRVRGLHQFYGANRTGRWCLAEGTPVLVKTSAGSVMEKPIETVGAFDQVWDGDDWVSHEGVVFSGDKDVITWDGVTATPEHVVWVDADTKMPLGEAMQRGLSLWSGNAVRHL